MSQRDLPQPFPFDKRLVISASPWLSLGSLWLNFWRFLGSSDSLWLPLALSGNGNHWFFLALSGPHCLSWALSGSNRLTRHLLGSLSRWLRERALSIPGCSYAPCLFTKKRLSMIQKCFVAKQSNITLLWCQTLKYGIFLQNAKIQCFLLRNVKTLFFFWKKDLFVQYIFSTHLIFATVKMAFGIW